MAKEFFHEIAIGDQASAEGARDSVGGPPILNADQEVPRCKLCEQPMMLFLQLDLRAEFGLGFAADSHLLLFMCAEHNECAQGEPLAQQEHYAMLLNKPGGEEVVAAPDNILQPRALSFTRRDETVEADEYLKSGEMGLEGFKVGGVPAWLNYDQHDTGFPDTCSLCGSPFEFVLQIPDYTDFPKQATAPEQPDGSSANDYQWLLGNACYVLACAKQCDPRSLIVINDN